MENMPDDDTSAAIRQWEQEGSDLTRPMTIDFFVAVPNEEVGATVQNDPALKKFAAVKLDQDTDTGGWTVYCTAHLIPTYQGIVEVEQLLSEVAQRHGGSYDGFGSFGNG